MRHTYVEVEAKHIEVHKLVSAITYMDGWQFGFDASYKTPQAESIGRVMVRWEVRDIHGGSVREQYYEPNHWYDLEPLDAFRLYRDVPRVTFLQTVFEVYMYTTSNRLLHEIYDAIAKLEGHERMEHLKLSGKLVWNPHPPKGPKDEFKPFLTQPRGKPECL